MFVAVDDMRLGALVCMCLCVNCEIHEKQGNHLRPPYSFSFMFVWFLAHFISYKICFTIFHDYPTIVNKLEPHNVCGHYLLCFVLFSLAQNMANDQKFKNIIIEHGYPVSPDHRFILIKIIKCSFVVNTFSEVLMLVSCFHNGF